MLGSRFAAHARPCFLSVLLATTFGLLGCEGDTVPYDPQSCPYDRAEDVLAVDWGAADEGRTAAAIQAIADLATAGEAALLEMQTSCADLAAAFGAPLEPATLSESDEPRDGGDDVRAACAAALDAIDAWKTDHAGALSVSQPPACDAAPLDERCVDLCKEQDACLASCEASAAARGSCTDGAVLFLVVSGDVSPGLEDTVGDAMRRLMVVNARIGELGELFAPVQQIADSSVDSVLDLPEGCSALIAMEVVAIVENVSDASASMSGLLTAFTE